MEPRNRFREASRASYAKGAEEDRGGEEKKEGIVRIEEIIAEIGSKVGSKAKPVTARSGIRGDARECDAFDDTLTPVHVHRPIDRFDPDRSNVGWH